MDAILSLDNMSIKKLRKSASGFCGADMVDYSVVLMIVVVGGVMALSLSNTGCFIHRNLYQLPIFNSFVQYVRRPKSKYPIKYYLIRKIVWFMHEGRVQLQSIQLPGS